MGEIKNIQPENDVFCSVYRKDYIFWKHYEFRKKAESHDPFRLTPEKANKFLQVEIKPDFSKMEEYLNDMKELDKIRLQTLYRLQYGPKSSYKILLNVDQDAFSPKNDKFLINGQVTFGIPNGQVLPPLDTARRINAYCSYNDYRTPLSTYRDVHGRLGYDRVRQAADGGYCRMGPRFNHQKEMTEIDNIIRRKSVNTQRDSEETKDDAESTTSTVEEPDGAQTSTQSKQSVS